MTTPVENEIAWHDAINRGEEFLQRYQLTKDRSLLSKSLKCFRIAALMSSRGAGEVGRTFLRLGDALSAHSKNYNHRVARDQAILAFRITLAAWRPGHPHRWPALNNLGDALETRFIDSRNRADIDEAIVAARSCLELIPLDNLDRFRTLNILGCSLIRRFEHLGHEGHVEDLDESISTTREALRLTPAGHHNRLICLNFLAAANYHRFERLDTPVNLDEAIKFNRRCVELAPLGHQYRSAYQMNLAVTTFHRFARQGAGDDLDEMILNTNQVLQITGPSDSNRIFLLTISSLAHTLRFEHHGTTCDVEEAIKNARRGLDRIPAGHSFHDVMLGSLACALFSRYEQLGSHADLEEAILSTRDALQVTPPDSPLRFSFLTNLAASLGCRFERVGTQADLDEAISTIRDALQLAAPDQTDLFTAHNNLALALLCRFAQFGVRTDLDDAVRSSRFAVEITPMGHPNCFVSFGTLANALLQRFEQSGADADVGEAIALGRRCLKLMPASHRKRTVAMNNLSLALIRRHEQSGATRDLEEAILINRRALELTPIGHPNRFSTLGTLATALLCRFDIFHVEDDLDEAIAKHRLGVELTPPGHPSCSLSRLNLGLALLSPFIPDKPKLFREPPFPHRYFQDSGDLLLPVAFGPQRTEILDLFKEVACSTAGASPRARLRGALYWVRVAVSWSDNSAIEAYRTSLELLDILLATGSSLELRHSRLTTEQKQRTRSLAVDAAACALSSGKIKLAVEMLEQGRSVLFLQAGKYRTAIDDLQMADPNLANEFKAISRLMDHSVMATESQQIEVPFIRGGEDEVAKYACLATVNSTILRLRRYLELSNRWNKALERIRSIEGFELFLRPMSFDILRSAAAHGPVIVVNISEQRSDAIIIQSHADPLVVSLPNATPNSLLQSAEHATTKAPNNKFEACLRHLWERIVGPVVQALQNDLELPKGSRIWWCPTGAASRLPLHAAGNYTKRDQILQNIYVSSYTSTLLALIRSRRNVSNQRRSTGPLLVVGQANTPDQIALPSVTVEVDRISTIVPGATIIKGSEGTHEAVLHAMTRHSRMHIACHGHVNQQQPLDSHFALEDRPMTLLDVARQNLPDVELAFLAACHSAEGNIDRPDEVLHLTAGLQFAGVRNVVGTLWEMCDDDGPIIAEAFYSNLVVKEASSALALHRAVSVLRKRGIPSVRWACFVHYGQ